MILRKLWNYNKRLEEQFVNDEISIYKSFGTLLAIFFGSFTLIATGFYGIISNLSQQSSILYLILIAATIAFAEIIFILDPQKPNSNQNKFWFTAKIKLESYSDVFFGWASVGTGAVIIKNIQTIITYGIYPIAFFIAVVAIAAYIGLNSLKYRDKKEPAMLEVPDELMKS
jgi:hypothetical protein